MHQVRYVLEKINIHTNFWASDFKSTCRGIIFLTLSVNQIHLSIFVLLFDVLRQII